MGQMQKTSKGKTKKAKKKKQEEPAPLEMSPGQKKKLKELDEFMESVLSEAGEEFLDEFKQLEGE